jgi:hypothetical protein
MIGLGAPMARTVIDLDRARGLAWLQNNAEFVLDFDVLEENERAA